VTTRNVARAIEHSALQHRFISPKEVECELRERDYRILMLPRAIALSSREAKQISDFVEYGGTSWPMASRGYSTSVVGEWPRPLLSAVFAGPATSAETSFSFGKGKAIYTSFGDEGGRESSRTFTDIMETAGLRPRFPLVQADGAPVSDIEAYVFKNGEVIIVALLRDFAADAAPSSWEAVVMALPHPARLCAERYGGAGDRVDEQAACAGSDVHGRAAFGGCAQRTGVTYRHRQKFAELQPGIVYSCSVAQYAEHFPQASRIMQFPALDSSKWGQFARRSRLPMRWVYAIEQRRFFAYERHIAHTFCHAVVCTIAEKSDFERLIPGVTVSLVHNGVALDYFRSQGVAKRPGSLFHQGYGLFP
jgi:hypothetical protein